jgi:ceramide glucosyltransferase
MIEWVLVAFVAVGLGLSLLMLAAQWRQLAAPAPPPPPAWPPVSILKPLKGVDAGLERNLESFFALDYPAFELVFGVGDADDPALEVARRTAARHPRVTARFAVGGPDVGYNPKVNNLANILRCASHELLLISDSNVAVDGSMLRRLVARLEDADAGLATSFIRGVEGRGPGGALESLQLNTFVMGGVAAVSGLVGRVCAVGKSMLLRRADLARIGGFAELGRYLAEDQVCGELIAGLDRRVVVSAQPVDNVLGRLSVRDFAARHLRWARIRRRIAPAAYAAEILTDPMPAAVVLVAAAPGAGSVLLALATVAVVSGAALAAEHRLGVRRPPAHYPPLVVLRSLLVLLLWPLPFLSSRVSWRGRSFRIGPRTLLQPDEVWAVDELAELGPEEAVA